MGPVSGLQTQFCPVHCAILFDYSSCLGAVFGNSQALEAKQNVGGLFSVTLDDWALILIFFFFWLGFETMQKAVEKSRSLSKG